MRIADMDWQMVEDWTRHDDRAVLPIGSTEQHAGLSLATDTILAERLALDAAEPLRIPVFPALAYGTTASYAAFPGSVTLRVETLCAVLRDVLDSLKRPATIPPTPTGWKTSRGTGCPPRRPRATSR